MDWAPLLSVPILFLAAVASNTELQAPLSRASTAKSLNDFGSCFAHTQDDASRPWAFMPTANGGIFTNAGATHVAAAYWLEVGEAKPTYFVRLFVDKGSDELVEAINRCR